MDINDMQKIFQQDASKLGDYQLMTKTELANGYCDADEAAELARAQGNVVEVEHQEELRSAYHSALMLRYWYKIFEWAQNSSSLNLDYTEFANWLVDSLYVAFYYRVWRWENEAVVRHGRFVEWRKDNDGNLIPNKYYYISDPNAPDKIINRCCGSMRGRVYQYYNKDKRKAGVQMYSLDSMVDENGDSALDYAGCVSESSAYEPNATYYLVKEFLKRNEGIEALIVDGIANHDSFKVIKETRCEYETGADGNEVCIKHKAARAEFSPRMLVKHLNLISPAMMHDFCSQYSVPIATGEEIYNKLKTMSNNKLYKCIEKTLQEIKQTPQLLECLT